MLADAPMTATGVGFYMSGGSVRAGLWIDLFSKIVVGVDRYRYSKEAPLTLWVKGASEVLNGPLYGLLSTCF